MRAWVIASMLVLAACADAHDVAPPSDATYDLAFAVVTDREGRPDRVLESFAIDAGRVVADGPRYYELDLETEQLRIVGLTHAAIAASLPGYVPDRAEQIALAAAEPPGAPARFDTHLELAPPAIVDVLVLTDDDPPVFVPASDAETVRGGLTLSLPIDREYCRTGEELTPFGTAAELLPMDLSGAFFQQLHRLSDDRVLGLTKTRLFILDRDDPPDEPTLLVPLGNSDVEFPRAKRMVVERDGERIVALIAGDMKLCPQDDCYWGRTWRVEIDGDQLVSISTSTGSENLALRGIIKDGDRTVVVGEGGILWIGDENAEGFTPGPAISASPGTLDRIILTGDPSAPHLVGGTDYLYRGNAFEGRWSATRIELPEISRVQFETLAVARGVFWAVTHDSGYVLRAEGTDDFERIGLDLPPSIQDCESAGIERSIEVVGGFPLGDGMLFTSNCTALVRRDADGCTTSIPIAGRDPALVPDTLFTVHVDENWITVGGGAGGLYELRR